MPTTLSHWLQDPSLLRWVRAGLTAAAYVIAGVGLISLGIWDIYADWYVQGDQLWTTLVENAVTLAVGCTVFGVGVWITGSSGDVTLAALSRWTLYVVGFALVVTLLILGSQALQTHWKPWMMYGNFLGALMLAGFSTGLYASWLQHKAYFDPLTGLPNRNLLLHRLDQAIKSHQGDNTIFALLYIDLDNFKDVNEGLGQGAGDQLLRIVTRRLEEAVSSGDTVARLGGDELAVAACDIAHTEEAPHTAEALKRTVQEPVHLDTQMVRIQATIGIALYPDHATESVEMLRRSDAALRHGKRSGGNQWAFYSDELIREAANRVVVGGRLRKAIDEGEILVAYQPIVRLEDETVIGYEALARWHHPQEGWISPGRFIPVAEHNGLIEELAQIVVRGACAEIARADANQHGPIFISVNISPLQIHRPTFLETIRGMCDEAGISRQQLILELTEQAMLELDSTTLARLEEVRTAGISVAIDDFGTGYASLSYLKHLPADRLKLDRKFVSDLDQDRGNQAIVAATLTLAEEFGLAQTAEGVETRAEADKLRSLGYRSAQGYLFGKPKIPEAVLQSA